MGAEQERADYRVLSDMERMMNAMHEMHDEARKKYHLTLGQLIEALEILDPKLPVVFDTGTQIGIEHSYRGYYSDLAFEPRTEGTPMVVATLLDICQHALGATYTGYKGGDYTMSKDTPLWCSDYGIASGLAIMGI